MMMSPPANSPPSSSRRVSRAAPPTLFRVDDAWGHLTSGSHQSATAVVKDSSFDPVFDFFCDFHIFSLKAPKIVK